MRLRSLLAAILLLITLVGVGVAAPAATEIGFAKPYNWLFGGWVALPRMPLLADTNGDGYPDFLYATPAEKLIDLSINGRGLKPIRGVRLISDLPQPILSMASAHIGGKTTDIAVLGADGTITKISANEKGEFIAASVGKLKGFTGKGWIVAGKFSSTTMDDLAVVTPEGSATIIDSQSGKVLHTVQLAKDLIGAAVGDFDGDGKAEIAAQTKGGVTIYRLSGAQAVVARSEIAAKETESAQKFAVIVAPKGQQAFAAGDVNGDGKTDLLVNGKVFFGPDFKDSVAIAGWDTFKKPVIALLADINKDGKADVVVQHQGPDYYASKEADCNVYFTYHQSDPDWDYDGLSNAEEASLKTDPLDRDTDYDGLLDGWEVHGFWGIDMAAQGCSPLHKDVLTFEFPNNANEFPVSGGSPANIAQYMKDAVIPFYARLPLRNLDGKDGIAIHSTVMTPVPPEKTAGKGWGQLADEFLPRERVGTTHFMEISSMGSGGQSGQLADAGSCGIGSYIHEFGHQLGLSHTGNWAQWAPTYTSLMNYAYTYQFNGKWGDVHFSTGELSKLVLNETHLSEKVPYPIEKLKFLSNIPFKFRLKAIDPNTTWIDWNWNGILDTKPVRANISWGGGVGAGPGFNPSGRPADIWGTFEDLTDFAPELVVHKGKLYYLVVKRGPLAPTAPRPGVGLLTISRYLDNHSFTTASVVAPAATNDPSAVSDGKTFYVFYPTTDGVMYRFGQPDNLSAPYQIAETIGAYCRAFVWKGTVYLMFYYGPDRNIVYRTVKGDQLGPILDMGIKSTVPPGAAIDTIHNQLLLGTTETQDAQTYRWQLRRLNFDEKTGTFKQASWEWLGGEKSGWRGNRAIRLLFDASSDAGPEGRIYFFGRGLSEPATNAAGVYMAQSVAYKDQDGGWLLKQMGNAWYNSAPPPGVAWYNNEIAVARTWGSGSPTVDGGVNIAFEGSGVTNIDMADYNDINEMDTFGIARSIQTFAIMPPEK
jgi:hypothetical protein